MTIVAAPQIPLKFIWLVILVFNFFFFNFAFVFKTKIVGILKDTKKREMCSEISRN